MSFSEKDISPNRPLVLPSFDSTSVKDHRVAADFEDYLLYTTDIEILEQILDNLFSKVVKFYETGEYRDKRKIIPSLYDMHTLFARLASKENISEAALEKIFQVCVLSSEKKDQEPTTLISYLIQSPNASDELCLKIVNQFSKLHHDAVVLKPTVSAEVLLAILDSLEANMDNLTKYMRIFNHSNANTDLKFSICLKYFPMINRNYGKDHKVNTYRLFQDDDFFFEDELKRRITEGMISLEVDNSIPLSYVVGSMWEDSTDLVQYMHDNGFDYRWLYTFIT